MNHSIKTRFILVVGTAAVTLCLLAPAQVQAVKDNWLITPQEAAMDPAQELPGGGFTSIGAESDLGPKIDVVKPINGGSAPPPTLPLSARPGTIRSHRSNAAPAARWKALSMPIMPGCDRSFPVEPPSLDRSGTTGSAPIGYVAANA